MKKIVKHVLQFLLKVFIYIYPKKKYNQDPKTILIMHTKTLGLGDLIMDMPALYLIREKYPQAKIILLLEIKDFMEGSKLFDEIHILPKGLFKRILFLAKFKKADLMIFLNKALNHPFWMLVLRPKNFIGYIYNWQVKANFEIKSYLFVNDHYYNMPINVTKALGCAPDDFDLKMSRLEEFYVSEEDKTKVENLLKENKINKETDKIICINPHVNWDTRCWPYQKYIELINKLVEEPGIKVVVTGAGGDVETIDKIEKEVGNKVTYFTNLLNLKRLPYFLKIADVLISGDCGPMHIASAMNTYTISLFGPTEAKDRISPALLNEKAFYFWPKEKCSKAPCYDLENIPECERCKVIDSISVDEVYDKVMKLI